MEETLAQPLAKTRTMAAKTDNCQKKRQALAAKTWSASEQSNSVVMAAKSCVPWDNCLESVHMQSNLFDH
jgi:hypothetical protein